MGGSSFVDGKKINNDNFVYCYTVQQHDGIQVNMLINCFVNMLVNCFSLSCYCDIVIKYITELCVGSSDTSQGILYPSKVSQINC